MQLNAITEKSIKTPHGELALDNKLLDKTLESCHRLKFSLMIDSDILPNQ